MGAHHVRRLRSRKRERAVDEEGRHAGHAEPSCGVFRFHHLLRPLIAGQKHLRLLAREARAGSDISKDSRVADIAALDEVGREQPFHQPVLIAVAFGEPDQSMRVEGVRCAPDQVVPKPDPFLGTDGGDLPIKFLGT